MSSNQDLAVHIAESLLEVLPIRYGTTLERLFVAKASLIILECLQAKGQQHEEVATDADPLLNLECDP